MDQPTVLIVEDEARLAQALAFMLKQEGIRALVAADGMTGLALIRQERPALVLLDLNLPELDGLEVCRQVRADPALAELPILILTALGQQEHERAALASGATAYVRKPFRLRDLRDRIRAFLGWE